MSLAEIEVLERVARQMNLAAKQMQDAARAVQLAADFQEKVLVDFLSEFERIVKLVMVATTAAPGQRKEVADGGRID